MLKKLIIGLMVLVGVECKAQVPGAILIRSNHTYIGTATVIDFTNSSGKVYMAGNQAVVDIGGGGGSGTNVAGITNVSQFIGSAPGGKGTNTFIAATGANAALVVSNTAGIALLVESGSGAAAISIGNTSGNHSSIFLQDPGNLTYFASASAAGSFFMDNSLYISGQNTGTAPFLSIGDGTNTLKIQVLNGGIYFYADTFPFWVVSGSSNFFGHVSSTDVVAIATIQAQRFVQTNGSGKSITIGTNSNNEEKISFNSASGSTTLIYDTNGQNFSITSPNNLNLNGTRNVVLNGGAGGTLTVSNVVNMLSGFSSIEGVSDLLYGIAFNSVLTNADPSPANLEASLGGFAFGQQSPSGDRTRITSSQGSLAFGSIDGAGTNEAIGLGSFAGGVNDIDLIQASGNGSFAFGFAAGLGAIIAGGDASVAMGYGPLRAMAISSYAFGTGFSNLLASSYMIGFGPRPSFTVTATSITNSVPIYAATNLAPFSLVAVTYTTNAYITNIYGCRADFEMNGTWTDAATGDPSLVFTNGVTGQTWTNNVALGLAKTVQNNIIIPDVSPNDFIRFSSVNGTGASFKVNGAWWHLK